MPQGLPPSWRLQVFCNPDQLADAVTRRLLQRQLGQPRRPLGLATGRTMVPIYASSTVEQASYVLSHSDARVLFVDGEELLRRVKQQHAVKCRDVASAALRDLGLDDYNS